MMKRKGFSTLFNCSVKLKQVNLSILQHLHFINTPASYSPCNTHNFSNCVRSKTLGLGNRIFINIPSYHLANLSYISSDSHQNTTDDHAKRPNFVVDAHTGLRVKGPTEKKPYTWMSLKSRHKRAGNLLNQLNIEAMIECEKHRKIPYFKAGDALEVKYRQSTNSRRVTTVHGMVVGRHNRGLGSSFKLIGVVLGTPFEFTIPLYSPLIDSIVLIQRAFLYRGAKPVRRSKLYYVHDLPQRLYTIKDGFVAAELEKQKLMRKKRATKNEQTELSINGSEVTEKTEESEDAGKTRESDKQDN